MDSAGRINSRCQQQFLQRKNHRENLDRFIPNRYVDYVDTTMAPMFSQENFGHWKLRMKAHLAAQDYDMWSVITNGPITIYKVGSAADGVPQTEKPRYEWTVEDKRIANLDNVAMDILYKTLDNNMFNMIMFCTTAKEIWERLILFCEGNNKMKQAKRMVVNQEFNNVKMRSGETMAEFDERFTSIVIELSTLGKVYSNRDVVITAMKALPREYYLKTMVMRESKDLDKMELHDFFADLKVYEFEMNEQSD